MIAPSEGGVTPSWVLQQLEVVIVELSEDSRHFCCLVSLLNRKRKTLFTVFEWQNHIFSLFPDTRLLLCLKCF